MFEIGTSGALMNKKQFGTRKGWEHGHVVLGRRSAIRCRVIDRNDSIIFLELAELALLPFAFEVSIESVGIFICEVKSQRSTAVVGSIVTRSQRPFEPDEADRRSTMKVERFHRPVGFRPASGFKS